MRRWRGPRTDPTPIPREAVDGQIDLPANGDTEQEQECDGQRSSDDGKKGKHGAPVVAVEDWVDRGKAALGGGCAVDQSYDLVGNFVGSFPVGIDRKVRTLAVERLAQGQ